MVEMKIFTPPSGRFIFLMMRATVPTVCRSLALGESLSFLSMTIPMRPSPLYASSATRASSLAVIIRGVKIPGKIGRPDTGIRYSLLERVCSAGTMGFSLDLPALPVPEAFSLTTDSSASATASPTWEETASLPASSNCEISVAEEESSCNSVFVIVSITMESS